MKGTRESAPPNLERMRTRLLSLIKIRKDQLRTDKISKIITFCRKSRDNFSDLNSVTKEEASLELELSEANSKLKGQQLIQLSEELAHFLKKKNIDVVLLMKSNGFLDKSQDFWKEHFSARPHTNILETDRYITLPFVTEMELLKIVALSIQEAASLPSSNISEDIFDIIFLEKTKLGISCGALAKKSGVSRSFVCHHEQMHGKDAVDTELPVIVALLKATNFELILCRDRKKKILFPQKRKGITHKFAVRKDRSLLKKLHAGMRRTLSKESEIRKALIMIASAAGITDKPLRPFEEMNYTNVFLSMFLSAGDLTTNHHEAWDAFFDNSRYSIARKQLLSSISAQELETELDRLVLAFHFFFGYEALLAHGISGSIDLLNFILCETNRLGWSIRDLSLKSGLSVKTIDKYLLSTSLNAHIPSLQHMDALANAIGYFLCVAKGEKAERFKRKRLNQSLVIQANGLGMNVPGLLCLIEREEKERLSVNAQNALLKNKQQKKNGIILPSFKSPLAPERENEIKNKLVQAWLNHAENGQQPLREDFFGSLTKI